jgi:hypothetical protein
MPMHTSGEPHLEASQLRQHLHHVSVALVPANRKNLSGTEKEQRPCKTHTQLEMENILGAGLQTSKSNDSLTS